MYVQNSCTYFSVDSVDGDETSPEASSVAEDTDVSNGSKDHLVESDDNEGEYGGEESEGNTSSDMAESDDDGDKDDVTPSFDDEDELPEVSEVISAAAERRGPYNYRNIRRKTVLELMQH